MNRIEFVREEMKELTCRSGTVRSDSKFVAFIYELLRNHVPSGTIEECVLNSIGPDTEEFTFTNGYLAEYAKDVVKRLNS